MRILERVGVTDTIEFTGNPVIVLFALIIVGGDEVRAVLKAMRERLNR